MHRMDELQKEWGKKHLKLQGDTVVILNDTGVEITKIALKNPKEKAWIQKFYNIK